MLSNVARPLRRAARALVAGDWSRQLAAGFALGMVVGLVPSGHLIAVSLCVLLFSLRVNKGLGLAAPDPSDVLAEPHEEAAPCVE
jgi:uncharacterized protein (DUF2062 family)